MRSSTVALALTAALGATAGTTAALGGSASAHLPARANVTVTITAMGVDMFGAVKSARPAQCAANRTVKLYKLVDGEPHLFATDTTSRQGNAYIWDTGNTGTEGRFYAQVGLKPGCKADASPVIQVRRNP